MVRKKSAGCGCLNFQRRTYSRSARSNVSLPNTASRSTASINAGFWYAAHAGSRCSTGLSSSGGALPETAGSWAATPDVRWDESSWNGIQIHPVRLFPWRCAGTVKRLNLDSVPARRVPTEIGGRGPRDVTHLPRGEVPGLGAGGAPGAVRGGFRFGHDLHGLGGDARPGEAGPPPPRAHPRPGGPPPGGGRVGGERGDTG